MRTRANVMCKHIKRFCEHNPVNQLASYNYSLRVGAESIRICIRLLWNPRALVKTVDTLSGSRQFTLLLSFLTLKRFKLKVETIALKLLTRLIPNACCFICLYSSLLRIYKPIQKEHV